MALVEPEVIKSSSIFLMGMAEGEAKGEAKGLRKAITLTCEARGLKLTAARRAQLEGEARVEVLLRWHSRALTAARTADIFRDR